MDFDNSAEGTIASFSFPASANPIIYSYYYGTDNVTGKIKIFVPPA